MNQLISRRFENNIIKNFFDYLKTDFFSTP